MMEKTRDGNAGVVCLHCGIVTPVPTHTRSYAGNVVTHRPRFLVIRCEACGREAPYLADQIVTLEPTEYASACAA